ncbi:MAG: hypothetical protein PHP85_13340 [Gallionella sp.]|nr:hypothetical protein [Gallionella sp.]
MIRYLRYARTKSLRHFAFASCWLGMLLFTIQIAIPAEQNAMGFAYQETMENAGSKSAGVRGQLTFNGFPVLGFRSQQLRTPIGSYFYAESELLWEPQGWFPMDEIAVKEIRMRISDQDLLRGSYTGPRRKNTPEDWCYAPQMDTWFAPRKITGITRQQDK